MKKSSSLEEQFIDLLEKNKKIIYKVSNLYGEHADDRKDLSQEIILQLWKAFPNYDSRYAVSTWMYRIALNVSISFLRKEKTRKKTVDSYQSDQSLLNWDTQKEDERLTQVYQIINQLKAFDKAIIILYLEGHKNNEISSIVGISETNVATKINRIKKKISSNLKT